MDFKNLSTGGKIVLVSLCLAVISIFLPWVTIDGITQMGYDQQAALFLFIYIYPLKLLLANLRPNNNPLKAQMVFTLFGIVIAVSYIYGNPTSMYGAYLMLISLVLELSGCYKALKENIHNTNVNKESYR